MPRTRPGVCRRWPTACVELARQARGDDLAQAQRLCTQVGRLGAQAGDGLAWAALMERRRQALIRMTPRTFQRLVRLNAALSLALHDPGGFSGAGAALALEAGYCDQSHLGRDRRRLAGAPLGLCWPLHGRMAGLGSWPRTG